MVFCATVPHKLFTFGCMCSLKEKSLQSLYTNNVIIVLMGFFYCPNANLDGCLATALRLWWFYEFSSLEHETLLSSTQTASHVD